MAVVQIEAAADDGFADEGFFTEADFQDVVFADGQGLVDLEGRAVAGEVDGDDFETLAGGTGRLEPGVDDIGDAIAAAAVGAGLFLRLGLDQSEGHMRIIG